MLIRHCFPMRYARNSRRKSHAPVPTLDYKWLEQHAHG